jgi:hypothetical protein
MPTTLHQIETRSKFNEMYYALSGDFARGVGEVVDPRQVVDESGWSPYCLDATAGSVTFVRLPASTDLSVASFYYVTQFREANAVIDMPFADLFALAATLPLPQIALIFSIGRCGTTLASHAFNGAPEVVSLSEPECFNHLALRALSPEIDRRKLIDALMRFLFAGRTRRDATVLAVKFRSQALYNGEDFWRALPKAKYVFMYRDAVSWSESLTQFARALGTPFPLDRASRDFGWGLVSADQPLDLLARFADIDQDYTEASQLMPAGWSLMIEEYWRLLHLGVPFLALRYNELVANRKTELERVFNHCGIDLAAVDRALDAFDEDSQKGTIIERKSDPSRFDDAAIALLRKTLAKNPLTSDPDLRLPDIYTR